MVGALQERHTNQILTFLLSRGQIKKTDLLEIVSSSDSLSKTLRKLQEENMISMETKVMGRKIIHVSLTPKGRSVAEQLKRAEEAAKGKKFTFPDKFAIISFLWKSGPVTLNEIEVEFSDAAAIIRELEGLKVVQQEIDSTKHPHVNLIGLTEKGKKVVKHLKEIEEILKG